MIRKLSIVIGVALSLAACASATKRVEQGQELQRQGRPAEAAERYIQALKKDQKLDSARAGLRSAGAAAIDGYLRTAATDPNPYAAADAYLAIDDLTRRAQEVGIQLIVPPDYDARRRATLDRVIGQVLIDARNLAGQRQFADALNRLARAVNAYQPSSAQGAALGSTGAEVALAWARADTTAGQFRSAFGRVEPIPNIPGVSRAQTDDARALQAAALARGTRRVAIVPVWATVSARRDLPDDALPALGDALRENPWASPPQFVELVSPDLVERELRGLGLTRRTLTTIEAARLGRGLDADFVVVAEIDSVRRTESNVRVTRRPARTTRGADTAYVIEEGQARLDAHATFVLIDRNGQRWTDYQPVTASASGSFTRVRFAGDYRTLDLRQAERDLFANGANDELGRSFVGAMSPRLANAVFAEVVRRIP